MSQLNLFDWGQKESLLTDLGGRCVYCLESDNWLTTDIYMNDEHKEELLVQCQTVMLHEDGSFDSLCLNTKEIIDGVIQ